MGSDTSKPILSKSIDQSASTSNVTIKLTTPESIPSSSRVVTSVDQRRSKLSNASRNRLSIDLPLTNRATNIDDCASSMNSSTSSTNGVINDSRKSSSSSRRSTNLTRKQSTASTNSTDRPKHPLPLKSRQLIKSCLQGSSDALGRRIYKKAIQRRSDFGRFFASLTDDEQMHMYEAMKVFLMKTAANIDFVDEVNNCYAKFYYNIFQIQRLAEEFGAAHAQYRRRDTLQRSSLFKPDYFSITADAIVNECVLLDNASHRSHNVCQAFSEFVALIFTSVRDGYYNEIRRMRHSMSNSIQNGSITGSSSNASSLEGRFSRKNSLTSASDRSTSLKSASSIESIPNPESTIIVGTSSSDQLIQEFKMINTSVK